MQINDFLRWVTWKLAAALASLLGLKLSWFERLLTVVITLALGAVAAPSIAQDGGAARSKQDNSSMAAQGTVICVGGGHTSDALARAFIQAAGGPEAKIVVLAQASEEAAASAPRSASLFTENGATQAEAPVDIDPPALCARLAHAHGVWIPGGDQNRFLKTFPEVCGVPAAIRDVFRRGGVVGGTSAGASLMGELMPTGEDTTVEGVRPGACPTSAGLGLLPGVIVDQHFLVRNRLQRLLTAVLEHPSYVGIGIEEEGWAVLHAGRLTVGEGQVTLLRVPSGASQKNGASQAGGRLGASHIDLQLLLPGQSVSLQTVPLKTSTITQRSKTD